MIEEFTFKDEYDNVAKLWIELGLPRIISLKIDIEDEEVIFLHDQYLKNLRVQKDTNCIVINTKETIMSFVVWPKLSLKITRDQVQNYNVPLAN